MNKDLLRIILLRLSNEDHVKILTNTTVLQIFEDPIYWRQRLVKQYPSLENDVLPPIREDFDYLELFKFYDHTPHTSEGLDFCAKNNNIYLYRLIAKKNIKPTKIGYMYLLENGHLEEFLNGQIHYEFDEYKTSIKIAIMKGHLNIVHHFHDEIIKPENINTYVDLALLYGHVNIVDYFAEDGKLPTINGLIDAIRNATVPILKEQVTLCIKLLFINYISLHSPSSNNMTGEDKQKIINACAFNGNDELLNLFIPFGYQPDNIEELIINNKLNYIPYSIKKNFNNDIKAVVKHYMNGIVYLECARNGHVHILKMKPKYRLINREIENILYSDKDNLEVFKYILIFQNIPGSIEYLGQRCKRKDKLQYLIENGLAVLTPSCLLNAIMNKNTEIIDYLLSLDNPVVCDVYVLNFLCQKGNLMLLQTLIDRYQIYPNMEGLKNAAKFNHVHIIKYLQTFSLKIDKDMINKNHCGIGTLRWLLSDDKYQQFATLIKKKIKFLEASGESNEYSSFEL